MSDQEHTPPTSGTEINALTLDFFDKLRAAIDAQPVRGITMTLPQLAVFVGPARWLRMDRRLQLFGTVTFYTPIKPKRTAVSRKRRRTLRNGYRS